MAETPARTKSKHRAPTTKSWGTPLRALTALAVAVAIGLLAWGLAPSRHKTAPDSPMADGYSIVGQLDGDTLWAKAERSNGADLVAVVTIGADGASCNQVGPTVNGLLMCHGGLPGKAHVFVMYLEGDIDHVDLKTTDATIRMKAMGASPGLRFAFGVQHNPPPVSHPQSAKFYGPDGKLATPPAGWEAPVIVKPTPSKSAKAS